MPVAKLREVVTRIWSDVATIWLSAAAMTQNQKVPCVAGRRSVSPPTRSDR
jgi:hypothetical protein